MKKQILNMRGKNWFLTINITNNAFNFKNIRADVTLMFRYKKFSVTPDSVFHIWYLCYQTEKGLSPWEVFDDKQF